MKKKIAAILLLIVVFSIVLTACTPEVNKELKKTIDESKFKQTVDNYVYIDVYGEFELGYYENEKSLIRLVDNVNEYVRFCVVLGTDDEFYWSYTNYKSGYALSGNEKRSELSDDTSFFVEENIEGYVSTELKLRIREYAVLGTRAMILGLRLFMEDNGMGDMVDDLGFSNLL